MTIGLIAKLQVQPEKIAEFETAFLNFQQTVIEKEPGNLLFQLYRSKDTPATYTVMEQYIDQAALNIHQNADYYQAIPDTFGPFMAGPPQIEVFNKVT